MFRCQISGKNSKPGEKPIRVVMETRPVTYYKKVRDENGDLVNAVGKDGNPVVEGFGEEIVEERIVLASVIEEYLNGNT